MLPCQIVLALSKGEAVPQKCLSKIIDSAAADQDLLDPAAPKLLKAQLRLLTAAGADSWLHAFPSGHAQTAMDSAFLG